MKSCAMKPMLDGLSDTHCEVSMVRLRRKPKALRVRKGFQFATPTTSVFEERDAFFTSLHAQRENYTAVDAAALTTVDVEGKVEGNDGFRLTAEAFADLCKLVNVPLSFVLKLAKRNEALALQVLDDAIDSHFDKGGDKVLLVDAATGRVDGVTMADGYDPVPNADVMEMALSANEDMRMTRGWLEGPATRMTLVSAKKHEAAVNDLVQVGVSIGSTVGGRGAITVAEYAERLKCLNGMTSRDCERVQTILQGSEGVDDALVRVLIECSQRVEDTVPMMQNAARLFLNREGVRRIRRYLSAARCGGGRSLEVEAVRGAVAEAAEDGRSEGELCLWDFVNGVTEAAKAAPTLNRRRDLESVGYSLLSGVLDAAPQN